jgi:uncharacterized protein
MACARFLGASLSVIARPLLVAASLLLLGCVVQEGDAQPPATEKLPARATNRLSRETSPYLLSHAHNPVDWYPWGPEALEKAKQEDKVIFLSIGYSACHWCHVMEKKVFSNPEIARYMNEHFVNIKVDREERPDIDEIYMSALQAYFQAIGSNQTGGWPLSIFLTPTGKPLGGGTYFPPDDNEGRTGFPTLMRRVYEAWRDSRKQMEDNAEILANAVRANARPKFNLPPLKLDRALIAPVMSGLEGSYDAEHGGFGFSPRAPNRPKFPTPTKLALVQYESRRHTNESAARMLKHTLDRMAAGGIYDHLGGGFHRYSTDRQWRIPHFEKMLYDNAQLADIYAEAYRQTRDSHYRTVAEETIAFVLRDLTDPCGGFYSALDADSEGAEGKFYVWTDEDLAAVLTPAEQRICRAVFAMHDEPNFELGHVLEIPRSIDEIAGELKTTAVQLERELAEIKRKMLAARNNRISPALDDKVLTSWNGLMIRALARAGAIFENAEYIRAAEKSAEFILAEMRDERGRLLRTYRNRQAKLNAYLDDYAFLIEGLVALHLATNDEKWENAARRLMDLQLQNFWDEQGKGCFFTSHDHEQLLARTKDSFDSVMPSGNSVTVRNLLRLSSLAKQPEYRERARLALESFAPLMDDSPTALTNMALALSEYLDTTDGPAAGAASPRRLGIAPDRDVVLVNGADDNGGGRVAQLGKGESVQFNKSGDSKAKKKPESVTGQAYLSVDRLPAGRTCKLLVILQVEPGWHIYANPAGNEFNIPTELTLKSRFDKDDEPRGTRISELRYPAGMKIEKPDEEPQVIYEEQARLLATLEVPESIAGQKEELTLLVKYQACNEQLCLPPKTLKIVLPVDVARKGEQVQAANEKIFNPPRNK